MNINSFDDKLRFLAPQVTLVCLVLLFGLTGCIQAGATPTATLTGAVLVPTGLHSPVAPAPTSTATIRVELTIPAATPTPSPSAETASPTLAPTTPTPSPTLPCDQAAPGYPLDVTIPDDTQLQPGESFTKIWRLTNSGSCTWTRAYAVHFFYGAQMSAPTMIFLSQEVAPGQSVEISLDMLAPQTPGTYQGNWKLRNSDGALFGIGPRGDAPFWVRIVVVPPQPATATPAPTGTPSPTPTASATPTPTATPTPPVHVSGNVLLHLDESLDLDTGAISGGVDMRYQLDGSFHNILPQSGATMGIVGQIQPGLETCQSASMSTAPVTLESLSVGAAICYRTDQGRLGWLRFNGLDSSEILDLSFTTWVSP